MNEIVPAFRKSLFNDDVKSVLKDVSEVGFDSVFKEGVLRDIPIINTITALCKTGINIRERNFIKQTICFINEFNSGDLSQEKRDEHQRKLEKDSDMAEKELDIVLLFLDNNTEIEISKIAGRMYSSYVKGALSWDKFAELIEVNKRMFLGDYKMLILLNDPRIDSKQIIKEKYRFGRLLGLGLIVESDSALAEKRLIEEMHKVENSTLQINAVFPKKYYQLTPLGKTLLQYVEK